MPYILKYCDVTPRRSLNQTWTSRHKKSALTEKITAADKTCGGSPVLQPHQRATGTLFSFFCIAFCPSSCVTFSKDVSYLKVFFSFHNICSFFLLLREEWKPKSKKKGENNSPHYREKNSGSVSQHAHEGGAHQSAWQNWCVYIITYRTVYSYKLRTM